MLVGAEKLFPVWPDGTPSVGTGGQTDASAGESGALAFPTADGDWRNGSFVGESGDFVGGSAGREEEVVVLWVKIWAWVWRLTVWSARVMVPPPKGLGGNGKREFGIPAARPGCESVDCAHRILASVWQSCVGALAFTGRIRDNGLRTPLSAQLPSRRT